MKEGGAKQWAKIAKQEAKAAKKKRGCVKTHFLKI